MKKKLFPILGILLLVSTPNLAQDNLWSSSRPDGHAPISVMGDHLHKKGEFMLSYRFMQMKMEGNLSSSESISNVDIYQNYMVAPQAMHMKMHMLGFMFAPSNKLTLLLMVNYLNNDMDLITKMGVDFTTKSSGLSDLKLGGLLKLWNKNKQTLHANFGLSLPTGNIDQRDDTPMAANSPLAYPMQLGSGTVGPFLGGTYLDQGNKSSWGIQSVFDFKLGENAEGYTRGNRFNFISWYSLKLTKNISISSSLSYSKITKIKGKDPDLNPMMMPLFNTLNSGRTQFDLGLGTNLYFPKLKGIRFSAEVKKPLSQSVSGIQMKNKLCAVFGVQYAFTNKSKAPKKKL